jgi:hypothetical protein
VELDTDEPAIVEAEACAVTVAERRPHDWWSASGRHATSPGSMARGDALATTKANGPSDSPT